MSSRTKPLQLEEKVKRLYDLLQEKKTCFTLKELEKIAPKEKGIVSQSVKDVLDILVSENKAKEDKIGTSRYYWSFATDKKIELQNRKESLQEELTKLLEKEKHLTKANAALKSNRVPSEERKTNLHLLSQYKTDLEKLNNEIKIHEENDPSQIEALKEELSSLIEETNTITENIFTIKSYLCETFGMDRADFDKSFSISAEMDTFPNTS